MAYVSKAEMVKRFGERELVLLTDRDARPPRVIVDDVLDRAIADAGALAEGYVAKVYALPLRVVPDALGRHVADIAFYYLHPKADKDSSVALNYREAMSWLRDVSRGLITLDVGAEPQKAAGGGSVRASGPDRQFTRDSLRGL